jgi:HPt (histidine-containing phosphotransfer) domain-containing protein
MEIRSVNPETLASLKEYAEPEEPDFLRDILGTYLADSETRLAATREAYRAADVDSLMRLLHTLKGSSLNVGAEAFSALLQTLELEAKQGKLPEEKGLRAMEAEFSRVKRELSAYLDG